MGLLDAPMGQLAENLLGTFGRSATLVRPGSDGSYDPDTGTITGGGSATEFPCEVVFEEFGEAQIDGTLIKLGDRKAIVSRKKLGTEPVPDSDTLQEGGRTWRVMRVLGYSSGDSEAAYALHVRR